MNERFKNLGRIAVASLLISGLVSSLFAAEPRNAVDFEQGVDISAILSNAKKKADNIKLEPNQFQAAFSRWERDCAVISIGADDPTKSERVTLESRFYEDRCYPTGPNGQESCHEEWSYTERRRVRVEVLDRGEMLPWERDIFRVCLDGHWLNADVVNASHEYALTEPDWNDDTVVARAVRKVRSWPDPAGIFAASLRVDAGVKNFVLTLKDRWSSYYKGEQTVVSVKLKRHRSLWFDDTLIEKEFVLPSSEAGLTPIRFADYAEDFKSKLKDGKDYYVKWRFKRVGSVSTDKWQGWWETAKVTFHSEAALFVSASLLDPLALAKGRGACWLQTIEGDMCVYKCRDGSTFRQPVREPDPWDRDGTTIMCPQLVIPF